MWKFVRDRKGDISWLLSQISLLIASSFLLLSIAGMTFYNDWVKEAEIRNIASDFASKLYAVDLMQFPGNISYYPPEKSYEIFFSSEYVIVIRHDGILKKNIEVHKELLINPWIRLATWEWKNGDELIEFLDKEEYKRYGYDDAEEYIKTNFSDTKRFFSLHPFKVNNFPIVIEKIVIPEKYGGGEYVLIYER